MLVSDTSGIAIPIASYETVINSLSEAFEKLYENPSLCKEMGQTGKHRIDTVFSMETLAERMSEVYQLRIKN